MLVKKNKIPEKLFCCLYSKCRLYKVMITPSILGDLLGFEGKQIDVHREMPIVPLVLLNNCAKALEVQCKYSISIDKRVMSYKKLFSHVSFWENT